MGDILEDPVRETGFISTRKMRNESEGEYCLLFANVEQS